MFPLNSWMRINFLNTVRLWTYRQYEYVHKNDLQLAVLISIAWFGSRKGIQHVKKLSGWMLAWLCVWVKMHIWMWSGTKSKRTVKWLCVCVCVCACACVCVFKIKSLTYIFLSTQCFGQITINCYMVRIITCVCTEPDAHCPHAQPWTWHSNSGIHCRPREDIWSLSRGWNHIHIMLAKDS